MSQPELTAKKSSGGATGVPPVPHHGPLADPIRAVLPPRCEPTKALSPALAFSDNRWKLELKLELSPTLVDCSATCVLIRSLPVPPALA